MYLTCVQLEEERDYTPFREQVAAIADLIKEGKVRHWGLSNETTFGAMSFAAAADALGAPRPASVQNCFNLVHRCAHSRANAHADATARLTQRRKSCTLSWDHQEEINIPRCLRTQDVRGRARGGLQPAAP